jgi:hypothetical protein
MAFSGSQVTRMGLYGGSRGLYGSFVGKAAAQLIKNVRLFMTNINRMGLG